MKIIAILLVSLMAGIGIGWYFGYTRPIAKDDRDARQEMLAMQTDQCRAALVALRAVFMINSGHTQKAVEWLSEPISSYYRVYALDAGTNEERLKMRALIEQLAQTNQIVAATITNDMAIEKIMDRQTGKSVKER